MTDTTRSPLSRAEAVSLGIVATGAVSVAVAALVALVRSVFEVFADKVTLWMPIEGGTVESLSTIEGIRTADAVVAEVTFEDLSTGVRWLLLLEGALPALATVAVCAMAWWLGVSLIRSRPFRRTMSTIIGVAACLVAAGSLFGQILGAMARGIIVATLADADPDVYDTLAVFSIDLDLAPLGWAFALALVATAFSIGARMQKDTEGLV